MAILTETCDNAVRGEGANEDLGFITALLAASDSSGDAALLDLRKRRAIISRVFDFLVVSTTTSELPRFSMRPATSGEGTFLILPSRLRLSHPPPGASPPTPPPMANPPAPTVTR